MRDKKQLPAEYRPMRFEDFELGMKFGPIEFIVSQETHQKTLDFLNKNEIDENGQSCGKLANPHLLVGDYWGFARVLSSYFGRLNEAIAANAQWEISGNVSPNEKLNASSIVIGKEKRKGLPFINFTTIVKQGTENKLVSNDEILLLADINSKFYSEKEINFDDLSFAKEIYRKKRIVDFRYDWDPEKWKNNIHTDEYARKFGYEKGLPEFITYNNMMFAAFLDLYGNEVYHMSMRSKKYLPLYKGDKVDIAVYKISELEHRARFFRNGNIRVDAELILK